MLDDLKRALARVQADYAFYVDCQTNPAVALAGYDLSADERSALTDPKKLADVLRGGLGVSPLRITVTIKGRHDWVNVTRTKMSLADHEAKVATEISAIKHASTGEARTGATLRLMELLG